MKGVRVNEGKVLDTMRSQGMNHEDREAVMLEIETNGSFSVVNKVTVDKPKVFSNVSGT